jgi:hypothetical protein
VKFLNLLGDSLSALKQGLSGQMTIAHADPLNLQLKCCTATKIFQITNLLRKSR